MAGRLGGEQTTVQNLFVQRIDTSLNLIYVKGAIPGPDDGFVFVRWVTIPPRFRSLFTRNHRDAKKKIVSLANAKFRKGLDASKILPTGINTLPFPAGDKTLEAQLPSVVVADSRGRNPFVPRDAWLTSSYTLTNETIHEVYSFEALPKLLLYMNKLKFSSVYA